MRGASTASLPADGRSPALARRQVRQALTSAGALEVLDEALLLVTELVTNAVIHAGTAVELLLDTSGPGLRAEVVDRGAGALPTPARSVEESREGGRGLFLLDALARSWGTTHTRGSKSVWFQLGGDGNERPARRPAAAAPLAGAAAGPPDVSWLVSLPDDLEARLGPALVVRELLHRLADGIGLECAAVLVDAAEDAPRWRVSASVGVVPDEQVCEQVRRHSAGSPGRSLVLPHLLVLPLRSGAEPFGALVLPGADLDATSAALARLVADRLASVIFEEQSRDARLRSRGSLALLAEASEMFAGSLDVTLAATLLAQLVVPRFASWSAVFTLLEEGAPRLVTVADGDETRVAPLRVRLSGSEGTGYAQALAAQLTGTRPVLHRREDLPPGLRELGAGELLAVPLVARQRLLGILVVTRTRGSSYASDEVSVLCDLGRRAALAVANARLYEERVAVAQALQASLLPPALPVVPGLQFGARYAAAGEGNEVGGDFYDVFPLQDGGWAVAIGDVCGKGAEAAAITGLARSVLRLLTEEGRPAGEVFARLNRAILDLGEHGRFCTTALATLHPYDGGVRVTLASAGHPPPALLRTDGSVSFVGSGGTLLGVVPDLEVSQDLLDLEVGEQLVFYTDGVTERRDGDRWFGEESLAEVLRPVAGRPADRTAGHLEESVRGFARDAARDDLAVLVVRALAPAVPPARPQAARPPLSPGRS